MSQLLPRALTTLIDELGSLPGVGPRTAERFAYYLLKRPAEASHKLAGSIDNLHGQVKLCPKTFAFIDANQDLSPLYSDFKRDRTVVAVVEEPFDVIAVEKTKQFRGTYHVLGGAISPIDNIGPEQLHIPELLARLRDDKVAEVILATNASVEGESTALFLKRHISQHAASVSITRLARGIAVGVDLEYADQITLGHALAERRAL